MKTNRIFIKLSLILLSYTISAQSEFKVEKTGRGEAVLLFPGFTCPGDVYKELVEELSKSYEVHNFTFAGFGDVAPIEKPWLPKIKIAIENYISEKQLNMPIVIGHSMGGALGLWLASDNPNLLSKLIVIDALPAMGALMMPNYNSDNIVYDNPFNKRMLEMKDEEFEQMASQMAAGMTLNPEKHDQLKNWIIKTDRKTYVYGYTDLLKLDLREDLKNITIPVAILGATHPFGKETAKKNYEEQYQNLEDYNLKFAEGSGHFIMYDQPQWFLQEIKKNLKIKL